MNPIELMIFSGPFYLWGFMVVKVYLDYANIVSIMERSPYYAIWGMIGLPTIMLFICLVMVSVEAYRHFFPKKHHHIDSKYKASEPIVIRRRQSTIINNKSNIKEK